MNIAPPDITLVMSQQQPGLLLQYLQKCSIEAFTNTIGYSKYEPYREALLIYHTQVITGKVMDLLYKNARNDKKKAIRLKVTHAERITFSVLFKRVEVEQQLIPLEYQLINQLTLKA